MPETTSRHCFALLARNEPGVLARVVGLFSGRGYNIESLTADEIDHMSHMSRITISTRGTPMIIAQIKAQLERLVPVCDVINLTAQGKFVESCLAYVKIIGDAGTQSEAKKIATAYGARIADTTHNVVIFELTATLDKIDAFVAQLVPLGLIETACSGSVAMSCGETVLRAIDGPAAQEKSA